MNTRNITYPCLFGLGLVFATLSGCSGSAVGGGVAAVDQPDGVRQLPPAVQVAAADPAENAVGTSASSDEENGQPDGIDGKIEEARPTYQWPNPDRSEIFLPPASKPVNGAVDSRNEYGVALIGFANVDRKQVLLEIDGILAPLAEGDSRGELQVLSIDPPQVTLKRGYREWTVKLFDTPD
jgi:hypothetical protein